MRQGLQSFAPILSLWGLGRAADPDFTNRADPDSGFNIRSDLDPGFKRRSDPAPVFKRRSDPDPLLTSK